MRRTVLGLLLLFALLLPGAPALGDPVPPAGHQVLENGTFTLTEPVVIGPGSSLTIRNATVWLDFPTTCPTRGTAGYCQPQIMALGGRLRIVDSTVDTHLYDPEDVDSMYAISILQGNLQIERSTLRHARIVGGQGDGGGLSYVADSVFEDGFQGLSFVRGMQVRVERNTFSDMTFGVAVRDAESTIADNVFRRIGSATNFGRAIDVQSTIAGEKAYKTLATVQGNLVEDSHQALLNLNNFPNVIRRNTFRRNVTGSTLGLAIGDNMLNRGAPVYTDNVLQGNGTALQVYASGAPSEPETYEVAVRNNSIVGTRCTDIEVLQTAATVTLKVDAAGNWWGRPEGPADKSATCPATKGSVTVEPWLQGPPNNS